MSSAVTMRIDESLKQQANDILEEIGLNMTTYFTSSLKALVREKKVPHELSTRERANEDLFMHSIYNKLAESEADVAAGRTQNAKDSLQRLKEKHNV